MLLSQELKPGPSLGIHGKWNMAFSAESAAATTEKRQQSLHTSVHTLHIAICCRLCVSCVAGRKWPPKMSVFWPPEPVDITSRGKKNVADMIK